MFRIPPNEKIPILGGKKTGKARQAHKFAAHIALPVVFHAADFA